MFAQDIVLCHPVRTAIGAFGGSLKDTPAVDLGAAVIAETLRRAGSALDPSSVDSVVFGNVIQAGNRMNPARQASVGGGVPVSVPALTVNRVCGSGAQAVATAATEIAAGVSRLAIAGGMENMDRAPYLLDGGRRGYRMGNAQIYDSLLRDGLVDAFSGEHSGWHTEDLVSKFDITREAQDRWAERSQQSFAAAQKDGAFDAEIVGVDVKAGKETVAFARDEQPRPDTNFAALEKLRPAFRPNGTITAGNAPGLNSGASAMIVTSRNEADARGIEPFVRLAAFGVAAVEPGMFGLGPVPAVQQALQRAGWTLGDVERFEINEAFAAVPIAVARTLGVPDDIVNVEGGAIAHGHPIGATGAVLTTRLAHAMRRDGVKRAIVTLCIGGGQGIALALEAIA
ncbi:MULTISPECIES: thiolase family protein [Caballeronia]|uniref:Acetyl-CoA acetyltransferase n=1 Tax=Caballeronia zhejiangensis TaxID=871203 RepID=A0A656QDV0_9BURK|nr:MULTISPECIES: thiolase family protein [Caballeronia]EKS67212.1 acetyl-CoA acetyltransferase [Burkholderia sp. SJ98]KDR27681.1 acetyl-CoA acetyltransferase [Caballeronia zhejiangensis]MDR5789506.1 thiolase family protein [Caballeronia sp. LP003]